MHKKWANILNWLLLRHFILSSNSRFYDKPLQANRSDSTEEKVA
jgi:hypothetical protein